MLLSTGKALASAGRERTQNDDGTAMELRKTKEYWKGSKLLASRRTQKNAITVVYVFHKSPILYDLRDNCNEGRVSVHRGNNLVSVTIPSKWLHQYLLRYMSH